MENKFKRLDALYDSFWYKYVVAYKAKKWFTANKYHDMWLRCERLLNMYKGRL